MICNSVSLRNFRNIESADLLLDPSVTVFHGKNGQGKTAALEGIALFSQGRSFRTAKEGELVRFGETYCYSAVRFLEDGFQTKMEFSYDAEREKRVCRIDGETTGRMSECIGRFRAVLFTPRHLALVTDGPGARRNFLDIAISQLDRSYLKTLQDYHRALMQRNNFLKQQRAEKGLNAPFDETAQALSMMLASGAEILSEKREKYLNGLSGYVSGFFRDMTQGSEIPGLSYRGGGKKEDYYRSMEEGYAREIRGGASLWGAHRDDVEMTLNGKEARFFASQGQMRSFALAMKLAEGEMSKEARGDYPLFLLDDILSELDCDRRSYLLSGIAGRQVILTACDEIKTFGAVYEVEGGRFRG